MGLISVPAAIERIEDRTSDVRILTLAPLTPIAWRAGQYMHISVEGLGSRAYSLAASPGQNGHMVFHIRNMGGGLSAYLSGDLKPGEMVGIKGPYGDMNIDAATGRPVLMIAGGTGIAPMLALGNDIIRKGVTEEGITLIYGARTPLDVYCQPELDTLLATGEVTTHIVHDPYTPDQKMRELGLNLSDYTIYLSGPDPMMLPVHAALTDLMADPARVFTDADMDILQKAVP